MDLKVDRLTAKWLRLSKKLGGPFVITNHNVDKNLSVVHAREDLFVRDPELAEFIRLSKEIADEIAKA